MRQTAAVRAATRDHRLGRRWNASHVRVKNKTIQFIEAYFVTAEGMTGDNLKILHQLYIFMSSSHLPVVIAADWQAEPYQLEQTGWLKKTNTRVVVPPDILATCSASKGRVLDYFVVSRE